MGNENCHINNDSFRRNMQHTATYFCSLGFFLLRNLEREITYSKYAKIINRITKRSAKKIYYNAQVYV